jgi:N,N'-diacetyllegionaminate synthase
MDNNIFIIAEAGVNHNGCYDSAIELIDVAVSAGVDVVKFQTWKTELLMTKDTQLAEYQKKKHFGEQTQYDLAKGLELSYPEFIALKKYCDSKDIIFMSTADESKSAEFLQDLQDIFKIGSGEITNLPFLRYLGSFQKQLILSTGMATYGEIDDALNVLEESGTSRQQITVLHCNTEYPTPMEDVNLRAMLAIRDAFGVAVGYSDHTLGIEVPIAAVAFGATVIEKHFTLDCNLPGPDHKASLEPDELKAMVKAIRNIEKALGDGIKRPSPSETKNKLITRKSLVAATAIRKGEFFTKDNLAVKRPGTGISPMRWDEFIGQVAQKDYQKDELI